MKECGEINSPQLFCQSYEGKPCCCIPPPLPQLPVFRVQEAPQFTNTGVDFTGPLYVKNSGGAQSALYTGCVTGAIQLNLVPDSLLLVLFIISRDSVPGEDCQL